MNKLIALLLLSALIGCGTAKSKIKSTKKPTVKVATSQSKPYKHKVESPTAVVIDEKKEKIELLEATSKIKVTTEVVLAYINQFKGVAKENMVKHGIPASITLAQGILESGAGTGMLCGLANNHFGIKCHKEWTGPYVRYDDDSLQECFRKYEHAEESYRDHSFFLTSRPWYASLFKLPKDDYKGWAKGLKKAGYATDPKYPDKLIGLIERYQLQQYDAEALGIAYQAKPKAEVRPEASKAPSADQHVVSQGDTLYSISKKYNIPIEVLKNKNNLSDNAISIGQILIIR
ncbi:glucosaminidase domain-containing protein [Flavobacterium humi]|uniref:Peptidoglycan hydrolase n=1 Tax=Flavobacterium humi TaxID=2562683 RepID=A0A4Z0L705_9FLAO|nr:glucosaminidase domain-containing protein [Flavobacterium humi]TGD56893.1 LysM peptidoglycan-binding domain-containing protein [Flavobacterium humi]